MLSRVQKQMIIGGVYVVVIALIGFGFYWKHYAPSCMDGVKNGKEEGVDCGVAACGVACAIPVQALQIQAVNLVKTSAGDYDFAAPVYNPNVVYGVQQGTYEIVFTDATGTEVSRKSNLNFYMLPGQTKYLVQTSLKNLPDGVRAHLDFKSINWTGTTGATPNSLIVAHQNLTPGAKQSVFEATITNTSDFDFDMVDIGIIVFDHNGAVISTNTSNIETFLSHTDRYFKVTWPFALPADARVYIEAGTNVFDNANFLKQNGTQEKFQQFF